MSAATNVGWPRLRGDLGQADWNEPFPAHRDLRRKCLLRRHEGSGRSYLITTPEGHILINSGFEATVPLIRKSVESLGYKPADIRVLLASHAHSDHVAGHALMKELTGAKVYVMRGDDGVIASGGKGQYLYATSRWKPCPVDRVLEDGDEVKLGGVTLVARRTPGHTRGCTTWTWKVENGGKTYDVVVIGSPNVNPGYRLVDNRDYPEIADDFARTFEVLKGLRCDVFLGAHGGYYGMIEKYERGQRGIQRRTRSSTPRATGRSSPLAEGRGVPQNALAEQKAKPGAAARTLSVAPVPAGRCLCRRAGPARRESRNGGVSGGSSRVAWPRHPERRSYLRPARGRRHVEVPANPGGARMPSRPSRATSSPLAFRPLTGPDCDRPRPGHHPRWPPVHQRLPPVPRGAKPRPAESTSQPGVHGPGTISTIPAWQAEPARHGPSRCPQNGSAGSPIGGKGPAWRLPSDDLSSTRVWMPAG